ncbi:hypothetical protein D3C77_712650 [compost metagenome]
MNVVRHDDPGQRVCTAFSLRLHELGYHQARDVEVLKKRFAVFDDAGKQVKSARF